MMQLYDLGEITMKIEQLQYFKAVAETNNMTEAARKMYVTPAAISIAISKLEQELGVRLFDRTTISVALNDAGKAYYEAVTDALQILEDAENVLRGGVTCTPNRISFDENIPDCVCLLNIYEQ